MISGCNNTIPVREVYSHTVFLFNGVFSNNCCSNIPTRVLFYSNPIPFDSPASAIRVFTFIETYNFIPNLQFSYRNPFQILSKHWGGYFYTVMPHHNICFIQEVPQFKHKLIIIFNVFCTSLIIIEYLVRVCPFATEAKHVPVRFNLVQPNPLLPHRPQMRFHGGRFDVVKQNLWSAEV